MAKNPMLMVVHAARIPKKEELDLPDLINRMASSEIEIMAYNKGIRGSVSVKYPKRIPMIRNKESLTEFCLKNTVCFYKSAVPISFP
jgi:DhnA family fructose-bisphosphate aldolase class Ia